MKADLQVTEDDVMIFITFDEWTDSGGRCIINMLAQRNGKSYVVASRELECKGPNNGLENNELSQVVHDALIELGLTSAAHIVFETDGDGVVGCAVNSLLLLYPNACKTICISHMLNNCGKAALEAVGYDDVQTVWRDGRSFLHAKKHGARRRRWFALLKQRNLPRSVPPKWCETRWCGWRDVAKWWLEHIIVFRDFLNAENQRTKGEVEYIVKLLDRLKKARRSLSIRMAFQSDHLQALAQLIKEAEQGAPLTIVARWHEVKHELQHLIRTKSWSPRIGTILDGWQANAANNAINAIVDSAERVVEKMDFLEKKNGNTFAFFDAIGALDPRQLPQRRHEWDGVQGSGVAG